MEHAEQQHEEREETEAFHWQGRGRARRAEEVDLPVLAVLLGFLGLLHQILDGLQLVLVELELHGLRLGTLRQILDRDL